MLAHSLHFVLIHFDARFLDHRLSIDAHCLSIIYICCFLIDKLSMALAGFNCNCSHDVLQYSLHNQTFYARVWASCSMILSSARFTVMCSHHPRTHPYTHPNLVILPVSQYYLYLLLQVNRSIRDPHYLPQYPRRCRLQSFVVIQASSRRSAYVYP